MVSNLLDISVSELLEKFGKGSHKPGSGSAAAFHGMLSAKLILTVIRLTNDKKRRHKFQKKLPELLKIEAKIENKIYPELEELFKKDSVVFGDVINLRRLRDGEKEPIKKSKLILEHLDKLKSATEIPIRIADLCLKLSEFATIVFNHGFQHARGDSGVALNNSMAAVAGCLSIVDLNLLSFRSDEWTKGIRSQVHHLRASYEILSTESKLAQDALTKESDQIDSFHSEINVLLTRLPDESTLSNSDIENLVTELQRKMWRHKNVIWKKGTPTNPIDLLDPEIALKKVLGYQFIQQEEIEIFKDEDTFYEVAGSIDKESKIVTLYGKHPKETHSFTTAHELGHAVLHKQITMHRDIPLDGSRQLSRQNRTESQANKFASCFLMPRKQVNEVFRSLFFMERFVLNEETAFALNNGSLIELKGKYKDLQGLARFLASVNYFDRPFEPISKMFRVSVGAMAIRLIELDLIEF